MKGKEGSMGFFDSFSNSYNKAYDEKLKSTESLINQKEYKEAQALSTEIAEREEVENMNDGMLLQKYKSAWTSVRKKELIEQELYSRGYRKTNNGNWDKR